MIVQSGGLIRYSKVCLQWDHRQIQIFHSVEPLLYNRVYMRMRKHTCEVKPTDSIKIDSKILQTESFHAISDRDPPGVSKPS